MKIMQLSVEPTDILGDIAFDAPTLKMTTKANYNSTFATSYVYPNGSTIYSNNEITSTGLPNYLASPPDIIDADFLLALNFILKTDISISNPSVVATEATSVLNITKQSDVSITYVSSSASFYNTLGYYPYNTATGSLAKSSDISKIAYIFPNCRYTETKKEFGIRAGNKVA